MKLLSAALAAAFATAAVALPTGAFAQNMPGPDAHQPMPDNQMNHGDMRGDMRGDMHQGDARSGDMHRDWHGDGMRHHGWARGMHRGWQRHCWTAWRNHHRARVCR